VGNEGVAAAPNWPYVLPIILGILPDKYSCYSVRESCGTELLQRGGIMSGRFTTGKRMYCTLKRSTNSWLPPSGKEQCESRSNLESERTISDGRLPKNAGKATHRLKKVAAIVLNWNGLDDTLECLESIRQSDYPWVEIIVVDNGSEDDVCAVIRAKFPEISLIENGRNLGFVRGNNIGLAAGLERGAELLLILNNDTILEKDCISELARAFDRDASIGIAGPLMRRTLQPDLVDMGGDFNFWTGSVILRHCDFAVEQGEIQPIDYVWGCGLMTTANVLHAAGLFDERYVAYYEDADFCMRARRLGHQTVVAARARMVHKVGRSGEKRFLWQTYMRLRNHILFFLTYARPYQVFTLIPALCFFQIPAMLLQTVRLYMARKLMPRYRDRPISLWYRHKPGK
jgi:GT2 family glycosyltransferase